MKHFLKKCIIFLFIYSLFILMGLFIPASIIGEDLHYAVIDKHDLLRASTKSPRIIVSGGSNISFGIYSPLIIEQFGVNVINTGIHAGYGIKYMIDDLEQFVQDGDIVVFIPEYSLFFDDKFLGQTALVQGLEARPKNISLLNIKQFLIVVVEAPRYSLKKSGKFLRNFISPNESMVYRRSAYNEYGDMVAHWQEKNVPFTNQLTSGTYSSLPLDYIEEFALRVEQGGGQFFMSFPTLNQGSYEISQQSIDTVFQNLRGSNLEILGTPDRYSFSDDLHYDTHYHLSKEGQMLRTQYLIEDLMDSIFMFSLINGHDE